MTLQIFTDGSFNTQTRKAGWGYVFVDDNIVLYANCGKCKGDSLDGEYGAVIDALASLSDNTQTVLVTDVDIKSIAEDAKYDEASTSSNKKKTSSLEPT